MTKSQRWFATLCVLFSAVGEAWSDAAFPSRPIRMIVGFPPGGGTDIVARIIAQNLTESLGQQVLVDNRAGASGIVGAEVTAKAAPDGYTIMMAHQAAMVILPSLIKDLKYDTVRDFAPISMVATGPELLVVHPSLPVKTVGELVRLAKAHPGQLNYASAGIGTNMGGELFKYLAKVDIVHVPYKGSGQLINDLLAGQLQLNFAPLPVVQTHLKSGRLRPIAVTSAKRSALVPQLPTMMESGVAIDKGLWWGLVAPAGAPAGVLSKLNDATLKLLRQPALKEKFSVIGAEPVGNSPDDFSAHLRTQARKYADLVKAANITVE